DGARAATETRSPERRQRAPLTWAGAWSRAWSWLRSLVRERPLANNLLIDYLYRDYMTRDKERPAWIDRARLRSRRWCSPPDAPPRCERRRRARQFPSRPAPRWAWPGG